MVLSLAWLAALGWLLWLVFQVLRVTVGSALAAAIVVLLAASPILLTAIPTGPDASMRLPCPRNWAWTPAWMLRPSPLGSLRFDLGAGQVKLCYGRPAARGRAMLGGRQVPYGQLWRTGANEPTTIISTVPIEIAGIRVPSGRASLYTIPGPETWEVLVNGSTSQWGIESEYTEAVHTEELGRAIVPARIAETHRERLTFVVEPAAAGTSERVLTLEWERTRVSIPVRVSR